ncbi:MAG: hypothetical protein E7638_04180 [Ruminococcaceae bacterium]|nr:hypothetical protein [Oscillospiraceae bacterium]
MYTVFAVMLTVGLSLLSFLGARSKSVRGMKKYLCIEIAIAAFGAVMCLAVPFVTHGVICGGDNTEEWISWAWDAFTLFVKTTLPASVIFIALACLTVFVTSAAEKGGNLFSRVVRQSAALAVSVILLFIAPFYSAMAETDGGAVHIFILVLGVCEALLMRSVFVCEMAVRIGREKKHNNG